MILKRLKLVNYGGIYNGLGLNEIEIDFTKCQHRIILIKGDNGSGKSTIENALKPLPDDNTAFINGKNASKEIEYIDEFTGTIYSITFLHEVSGQSRKSRGFITKTVGGNTLDLNPSGNITSCKDIIYDELQLDPNYITLTQLSSNKRGIADLRPADRKRYVNAILTSTDVYNDMYKVLSKKASTYKSMVQSIASKLDNIGNVVQLEQNIRALDEKISEIETLIDKHNEIMNKEKGMLNSIDPDNKLRERIDYLTVTLNEYEEKRNESDKLLRRIYTYHPELTNANITQQSIDELNSRLIELSNIMSSIKSKISILIESRKTDSEELQAKTTKLKSINSSGTLSEVKQIKADLTSRKSIIEKRWNNVIDINCITPNEFISIYDTILEMIEVLSGIPNLSNDIDTEYRACLGNIKSIEEDIDKLVVENNHITAAEDKISILEKRPVNCTDDSCPFIADALKAKSLINKLMQARKGYKSISQLNKEKETYQQQLEYLDEERYLMQLYTANQRILKALNFGFDTYHSCMTKLKQSNGSITITLSNMLNYVNDIEEYKKIDKSLSDIENKFHALSSQEDFINMIVSDISRLENQLNRDIEQLTDLNNELDNTTSEYNRIQEEINIFATILGYERDISESNDAIRILQDEINTNKINIDKIQKINSDIEKLTTNISELKEKLKPLKQERETLNYNLKLSGEYDRELTTYKSMYEKIDTLKYYCSPTTGIQLLFANMYLNKILDNANNILRGLFGGVFALLPLIITENEFRIPVAVNGGINHDDITSMSSAQVSLISMIISIALLSQTSTKLNIIVGDEIDAPFDSENRREFITILYKLMSLVSASQCVLISHNSEIPLDECDIILLKSDNDVITNGNIIWSYR